MNAVNRTSRKAREEDAAEVQIPSLKDRFALDGENLTREKYQIIDGYPMPGAIFFGGLHLSINR